MSMTWCRYIQASKAQLKIDITKTPTIIILVLIVSLLRLGKETWAVSYRLPTSKGVQNGQVLNKSISKQGFSKET